MLNEMINEGVRAAYNHPDNKLRASIMDDPAGIRKNTGDNTPAVIHTEIVKVVNEPFHYQKWPSFRVHIPSDQAIHTWHCDGDPLHKHPPGEINFFLPLTKCYGTNTIWVESEPWKLDFKPIELDYGEYHMFNGNQCLHGNKPNKTNLTRVSFDFRIMPVSKYDPTWNVDSPTSHTKFIVGEYYKELYK